MVNRQNKYHPDTVSPPGETLEELLIELGMTQKELAERMDRPEKTISEIVKGKAMITPETAIQLEHVFAIPANFWIQREANYQEFRARINELSQLESSVEWLKSLPISQMIKLGWIEKNPNKVAQLQAVLKYFGVASVEGWNSLWYNLENRVTFRKSSAQESSLGAIAAWLRHGEVKILQSNIPEYNEKRLKENLSKIKELTLKPNVDLKLELKNLCNEAGVNIIFTAPLLHAPISGAVRWVGNRPLIQLSVRGKHNDKFWFTFFHEIGHILLHGKRDFFLEGLDENHNTSEKEVEADKFASDFLIASNALDLFIQRGDKSPNAVIRLAREQGVHSAIVVGQLQSIGYFPYSFLNDMKTTIKIEMD